MNKEKIIKELHELNGYLKDLRNKDKYDFFLGYKYRGCYHKFEIMTLPEDIYDFAFNKVSSRISELEKQLKELL